MATKKTNYTLLIVGAAVVAGYIAYKKGLLKIPGLPAVTATPSLAVVPGAQPLLPNIPLEQVNNPDIGNPITITAPDVLGGSANFL